MDNNSGSPKFSVIIPAYNAATFITHAIKSIKAQTSDDWELIIVENGSTDNTTEVCSEFLDDIRVSLIHSEKGVSNARNAGLEIARGEWVVFLDADDQLLNDALQKYSEVDEEFTPDLIVGEYDERGVHYTSERKLYSKDNLVDFLRISMENPTKKCNVTGAAFKLDLIRRYVISFDSDIRYAEDSVFFLEFLMHSEKTVTLSYPVYRVIYYPLSAVRSGRIKLEGEYIPAIKKIKNMLDVSNPVVRNEWYIFILNQLLVILVNDTFARKESAFKQMKDAVAIMKMPEYMEAIKRVDLSQSRGLKKVVFGMMKINFIPGILLACRVRQRQDRSKGNQRYV